MCQCDVFVIFCVLLYGVSFCLCAWAGGLNVVVCIVCGFVCAVLWCVLFVVRVFVLRVVYCVMLNGYCVVVVFICVCFVNMFV